MTELNRAICNDNLVEVINAINHGADPNKCLTIYPRETPLHVCIKEDRLAIAKFLIEVGANTTKECAATYRVPLCCAIFYGNLAMVKLLLDNGANLTMYEGLVKAIECNKLEIVLELIKRGADVNMPNSSSDFPIMCAAKKGNYEISKLLLENGANVNVVDSDNETILTNCGVTKNRNCEILKMLVEYGANVNGVNREGDTALIKAVRFSNFPAIKYLIEKKAELNVKNAANETPLSVALTNKDFRTFQLLIESGADPKLATEAIEAIAKKNLSLAAYMLTLENKNKAENPEMKGFTGHEEAFD